MVRRVSCLPNQLKHAGRGRGLANLALMLVGITLLTIEAFNPTGVLGLGGIIAFVLGAVIRQGRNDVYAVLILSFDGLYCRLRGLTCPIVARPGRAGARSRSGLHGLPGAVAAAVRPHWRFS